MLLSNYCFMLAVHSSWNLDEIFVYNIVSRCSLFLKSYRSVKNSIKCTNFVELVLFFASKGTRYHCLTGINFAIKKLSAIQIFDLNTFGTINKWSSISIPFFTRCQDVGRGVFNCLWCVLESAILSFESIYFAINNNE